MLSYCIFSNVSLVDFINLIQTIKYCNFWMNVWTINLQRTITYKFERSIAASYKAR